MRKGMRSRVKQLFRWLTEFCSGDVITVLVHDTFFLEVSGCLFVIPGWPKQSKEKSNKKRTEQTKWRYPSTDGEQFATWALSSAIRGGQKCTSWGDLYNVWMISALYCRPNNLRSLKSLLRFVCAAYQVISKLLLDNAILGIIWSKIGSTLSWE